MPLAPGTKLGPYEILSLIGVGGMGEVYKARDTRLNRIVALKLSKGEFTERFKQEATLVGQLNHKNICILYDVGPNFLVMEFVDGVPLKDPLPVEKAVQYAGQILDALDAAHRQAITHRDLKPANILVTREGIKLLDFGLAKKTTPLKHDDETRAALTMAGQITGTLQYMAPEQLQAKEADARSDIFAFGCVLYEMLSGARAFGGDNPASIIAAIMEREPEPLKTTPPLDRVIRKCLAKNPDDRFQTARDAKTALVWAMETTTSPPPGHAATSRVGLLWMAATAAFALIAAALAFVHFREAPPQTPLSARFQVDPPERFGGFFQISPDGRYLAMVAQRKLWIRPLGSLEAKALDGVEDPAYPFWSPDSASVGFFAQGKLKKIALNDGAVQTLCDAPDGRGAAWSRDRIIVFSLLQGGLQRVSAAGGAVTSITKPSPISQDTQRYPVFLPDGRRFLFAYLAGKAETAGIYVGSLDGSPPVRIVPDESNPGYAPGPVPNAGGYLLFVRERTLMAQPFDARALRTTGEMFPVVQQVSNSVNTNNFAFSLSANGVMAYRAGPVNSLELAWVDRAGNRLDAVSQVFQLRGFALAPDQTRLAVAADVIEKGAYYADIWRLETLRGTPSRFTYGPAPGWNFPVWSPDGNQIAYSTFQNVGFDSYEIRRKPWNMAGKEEVLLRSGSIVYLRDWSPDGKWLLYTVSGNLWLLPLEGDRKPIPFAQTPAATEDFGQFSPDGKWTAYVSNESGQNQVYVQPLPATGAKWQLSIAGGSYPRWRSDGKELFFIAADGKLMTVPIAAAGARSAANGAFESGAPQALFDVSVISIGGGFPYTYQPGEGGQRFLMALPPGGQKPPPITMVLNWQAGLKK